MYHIEMHKDKSSPARREDFVFRPICSHPFSDLKEHDKEVTLQSRYICHDQVQLGYKPQSR